MALFVIPSFCVQAETVTHFQPQIWQRWRDCLVVTKVPNQLNELLKRGLSWVAWFNHVSLLKEVLCLPWNKILKTADTFSLAGFEEMICHEFYSCRKWILPTAWGNLEVDPPLDKPPDEKPAQLPPWFQFCETLSRELRVAMPKLLTYRNER